MIPILLLSVQAPARAVDAQQTSAVDPTIVVTATRLPEPKTHVAASAVVIDATQIERLGDPLLFSFLRRTPSAAVATSGPAGSLTEVRIRGSEANHTLLFIDGIRVNDPAAGNTPRFELLNADIASRVEVVRGPQSALWGSEAIGGVIAVNGLPPAESGLEAMAEAGSHGFARASASAALASDRASIAAAIGWQRATGIDSFDGGGDRDGYRNLSGRVRASWNAAPGVELGLTAFSLTGRSEFDGVDLQTFVHADTLDSTSNRLSAGRVWARFGEEDSGWSGSLSGSLLGSSNRNFLASELLNRTRGDRWTVDGQLQHRFRTGRLSHIAIIALDHDRERFRARDVIYSGASDQDRRREHDAITAEWRSELSPLTLDIAVRHDRFSDFDDATSLRASALADIGGGFSIAASYGEGIAQPTFFDLYGFFPGDFVGNPSLKPERSRGYEASLRYARGRLQGSITGYVQRLHDEIVDVFDPATFLSSTRNRDSISRRSGVELELGWSIGEQLRLSGNYAYLDATEPTGRSARNLRESRRPTHSGALAVDGRSGRLTYGGSISYSGARADTNFDVIPSRRVRLDAYWLAGVRIGYRLAPAVELFARGANLLDADYQEAFGYRTEGRAIFAGVRFSPQAGRRSSP